MASEHEPAQTPPDVSSPPPAAAPAPSTSRDAIPPRDREFGVGFWLKLAALLFFLGWAIAFVVGNDRTIPVDFVFATGHVSLIWTILLLLAVGAVAGLLFAHLYRRHGRKKARKA